MKKVILLVVLVMVMLSGVVAAKETLTILTWPLYYSPELIADFEREFDVKIQIIELDSYAKAEAMMSKVDLLIFGRPMIPSLIKRGRLQPLDKDLLPNLKNLMPMFANMDHDPQNIYTLPYHYQAIGLAYNKDKLSESEATMQNYFEPTEKLRGRVVTFPDARVNICYAMKHLGKNFESTNKKDLDAATKLLENLKKYATKDSGDLSRGTYDPLYAINEGRADLTLWYYTANSLEPIGVTANVGLKLPEQGAYIDMDCFMIPRGAKNTRLAHEFINYFYEPRNAAKSVTFLKYAVAVNGVKEYISPSLAEKVFIPTRVLKLSFIPKVLAPEEERMYIELWKSAFGK